MDSNVLLIVILCAIGILFFLVSFFIHSKPYLTYMLTMLMMIISYIGIIWLYDIRYEEGHRQGYLDCYSKNPDYKVDIEDHYINGLYYGTDTIYYKVNSDVDKGR